MAKNTIAMEVNLRKNENQQNAGYGKYYLEVARKPTLSLKGFAQHMVDHGSIYSRDVIEGVLKKITQCLPELIAQGVSVQLEPLGTFSPSIKNKKAGLTLTQLLSGSWDINEQVEGVHFNFLPYSVADENLTSRKFKEEWCTLQLTDVIKSRKETIDGKETVKDLTFPDFYDEDGENVNTTRVVDFVQKVMNWKKRNEENNECISCLKNTSTKAALWRKF